MHQLKLGIMAQSRKENEHRLPIHPAHFDRIDADLRGRIHLEQGYGGHFGVKSSLDNLGPSAGASFLAAGHRSPAQGEARSAMSKTETLEMSLRQAKDFRKDQET